MEREIDMQLSVLKDIRKIYANLNAEAIRAAAGQNPSVGLMATNPATRESMEKFLAPPSLPDDARQQALRAVRTVNSSSNPCDFVLCEPGTPVPANGFRFELLDPTSVITPILAEHQPLELALARTFPPFRDAVTRNIINRISRENALFAAVTALPNVIPSLIELPWTIGEFATDTAFLTMNQVRMALILAAAHGRDVGYSEQKAQIAAVVAGAFGWRALARELVGKIPLGGGLIPKAAVAFAGTYVVGIGLDKLDRTGVGLSKAERRDAYADAFTKGKQIVAESLPTLTR
jgi:hypothetical protein